MRKLLLISLIPLALLWAVPAWGTIWYITADGDNGNDGKSWSNAFADETFVDGLGTDSLTVGDTVLWGAGTWYDVYIVPPTGGDADSWTVYACSTWYTGTTAAEKLAGSRATKLNGGELINQNWADTVVLNLQDTGTVIQRWSDSQVFASYSQLNQVETYWESHFDSSWSYIIFIDGDAAGDSAAITNHQTYSTDSTLIEFAGKIAHTPGSGDQFLVAKKTKFYKAEFTGSSNCQTYGATSRCYTFSQGDSLLVPASSNQYLDVEGEFFHSTALDTIFIIPYHFATHPDNNTHVASCHPVFHVDNSSAYIRVWGFDMQMGKQAVFLLQAGSINHVEVEHCHIAKGGQTTGENASAWMSRKGHPDGYDNVVRACSLGWGIVQSDDYGSDPPRSGIDHGAGVMIYDQKRLVVESCWVYGFVPQGLFNKSCTYNSFDSGNAGIAFRYNYIVKDTLAPAGYEDTGIRTQQCVSWDSIYGNIVVGWNAGINFYSACGDCRWGDCFWDVFVANNTIYDLNAGVGIGGQPNPIRIGDALVDGYSENEVYYNIVSNIGNSNMWVGGAAHSCDLIPDTQWTLNYNMYYDPSYSFNGECWGGSEENNWTQWQAGTNCDKAYDANGWNTNPSFDSSVLNAARRNPLLALKRSGASQEINPPRFYGGRHWYNIGAVQNEYCGNGSGNVYFVSKNGNDSWNGLCWDSAFLTTEPIDNDGVSDVSGVGDTVIFGSGFWEDVNIEPPTGGSNTSWTVFACSTWYEWVCDPIGTPDPTVGQGLATLCGGHELTGWVYHSDGGGNDTIWRTTFTPDDSVDIYGYNTRVRALTQGDSLGPKMSDSMLVSVFQFVDLDKAGEYYHSNDTVYLRCYGSIPPESTTIIASSSTPVFYGDANVRYIKFWGLNATHGYGGPVVFHARNVDTCYFEHGWLKYGGANQGGNNSALFFSTKACTLSDEIVFRADSSAWGVNGADSGTGSSPPASGWVHGGAVVAYGIERFVIDSCALLGYYREGIMLKYGDNITSDPFIGSRISFTTVTDWTMNGVYFSQDVMLCSLYGCIIYGASSDGGWFAYNWDVVSPVDSGGGYFVANNTFYDVNRFLIFPDHQKFTDPLPSFFKNNVFYKVALDDWVIILEPDLDNYLNFDYNIWYDDPHSTFSGRDDAGESPCDSHWTSWQNCGYDTNGDTTDPGFDGAANLDSAIAASGPWVALKRSSVLSNEIVDTFGGRIWYTIGAVQNEDCDTGSGNVYYISKTGSDDSSGKCWNRAWATTANINGTIVAGDTVIFGSGSWWDVFITPPSGGDNDTWTVYACSSWYAEMGNPAGQVAGRRACSLWAGHPISAWTWNATYSLWNNTYEPPRFPGRQDPKEMWTLICDDSQMVRTGSDGAYPALVNVPGEFNFDKTDSTIYVLVYGSDDPDNHLLIGGAGAIFEFGNDDYIKLWGLSIMGGGCSNIRIAGDADTVKVEHCLLEYNSCDSNENPTLIWANSSSTTANGWEVRSCSLKSVVDANDSPSGPLNWWEHGGLICLYLLPPIWFDSNSFIGPAREGIHLKYDSDCDPVVGTKISHNYFRGMYSGGDATAGNGIYVQKCQTGTLVYGNIIDDSAHEMTTGIKLSVSSAANRTGYAGYKVFNNTIYGVEGNQAYNAGIMCDDPGGSPPGEFRTVYDSLRIFNNLVYIHSGATAGAHILYGGNADSTAVIDNNMYYVVGGSGSDWMCDGSYETFTNWQACRSGDETTPPFDANGVNGTDPQFDSVNATNWWLGFKRSNADQEVSYVYDGRTWYNYGAVQNEYETPATQGNPLNSPVLKSKVGKSPVIGSVESIEDDYEKVDRSYSDNCMCPAH